MPRFSFYLDGENYALVTGESPKGFSGILFAAWRGTKVSLEETIVTIPELSSMKQVQAADVPDDWYNVFANRTKLFKVRKPKPKPEPKPTPKPIKYRPARIKVIVPKQSMFSPHPVTVRALLNCFWMFVAAAIVMLLLAG